MRQPRIGFGTTEESLRAHCEKYGIGAIEYFGDVLTQEMEAIADHLRASWQDASTAKAYESAAAKIRKAIESLPGALGKAAND